MARRRLRLEPCWFGLGCESPLPHAPRWDLDATITFDEEGPPDGSHPVPVFPDVVLAEEGGVDLLDYPAIRRWLDRVKQIPGFTVMPGVFPYLTR